MKNIVIFASGRGSNAYEIIKHFEHFNDVKVTGVISNKKNAGVLTLADQYQIQNRIVNRDEFYNSTALLQWLEEVKCDMIVLAGFLWLIPPHLIEQYNIINIHPALLPSYGGKGMYGHHVHTAVYENKEAVSGMTVHRVNGLYDEGSILFQVSCSIEHCNGPDEIASEVLKLEHAYFKEVITQLLLG